MIIGLSVISVHDLYVENLAYFKTSCMFEQKIDGNMFVCR